jgi:hypothetical protein
MRQMPVSQFPLAPGPGSLPVQPAVTSFPGSQQTLPPGQYPPQPRLAQNYHSNPGMAKAPMLPPAAKPLSNGGIPAPSIAESTFSSGSANRIRTWDGSASPAPSDPKTGEIMAPKFSTSLRAGFIVSQIGLPQSYDSKGENKEVVRKHFHFVHCFLFLKEAFHSFFFFLK